MIYGCLHGGTVRDHGVGPVGTTIRAKIMPCSNHRTPRRPRTVLHPSTPCKSHRKRGTVRRDQHKDSDGDHTDPISEHDIDRYPDAAAQLQLAAERGSGKVARRMLESRVTHHTAVHDGIPHLPALDRGKMMLFEEPLVHLIGRRADSSDPLQPGLQAAT